jgi:hypothetical protein
MFENDDIDLYQEEKQSNKMPNRTKRLKVMQHINRKRL